MQGDRKQKFLGVYFKVLKEQRTLVYLTYLQDVGLETNMSEPQLLCYTKNISTRNTQYDEILLYIKFIFPVLHYVYSTVFAKYYLVLDRMEDKL